MPSKSTHFKKGFIPWNKGKKGVQVSSRKGMKLSPLSEEHKRKISEGGKGRFFSQEIREKIRRGNLGKIRSPEVRLNMSQSKIGFPSPYFQSLLVNEN